MSARVIEVKTNAYPYVVDLAYVSGWMSDGACRAINRSRLTLERAEMLITKGSMQKKHQASSDFHMVLVFATVWDGPGANSRSSRGSQALVFEEGAKVKPSGDLPAAERFIGYLQSHLCEKYSVLGQPIDYQVTSSQHQLRCELFNSLWYNMQAFAMNAIYRAWLDNNVAPEHRIVKTTLSGTFIRTNAFHDRMVRNMLRWRMKEVRSNLQGDQLWQLDHSRTSLSDFEAFFRNGVFPDPEHREATPSSDTASFLQRSATSGSSASSSRTSVSSQQSKQTANTAYPAWI